MFSRNKLMVGAVTLTTILAPGIAFSKELVATLIGPTQSAYGQAMEKFGKRVSELTDGELTVEIFANGQLGGSNEIFEQLRGGQIDIGVGVPGVLAEYAPEMQVLGVPFLFRDFDHWKSAMHGAVGDKLNELSRDKLDVIVLGYFGGSVRNLVSTKPVENLEDLAGLRIRLHPSEVLTTAWSSLGVQPTVMAYQEVYNGLQLGVVDGLENEAEWVLRMNFHEQAPYYILTEHEIVTRPFLFSGTTFTQLSPEHQAAVVQAGEEAAAFEHDLEHKLDAESREELAEEHGMKLVEIDREKFRSTVQEALAPVIEEQGIKPMVDEILAQ